MWFWLVFCSAGSARLRMFSSAWFCQKQTAKAIASATPQMIRRRAELVEVVDDAQPVFVPDGPQTFAIDLPPFPPG